jgi:hypothetical protein
LRYGDGEIAGNALTSAALWKFSKFVTDCQEQFRVRSALEDVRTFNCSINKPTQPRRGLTRKVA